MKINKCIDLIEKTIIILLIISFGIVIMYNVSVVYRRHQMVTGTDGREKINPSQLLSPTGTITIEVQGSKTYPQLEILVNGELYKKFLNSRIVTLEVKDHQVIEINGSMYDEKIRVKITDHSSNVKVINRSKEVIVEGSIEVLSSFRI